MNTKLVTFVTVLSLYVSRSHSIASYPGTPIGVTEGINGTDLVLVQAVFRHGDRAPSDDEMAVFPNSVFYNDPMWPYGRGALTNRGKLRTYQLGQFFRERYGADSFLSNVYLPEELYTYADDYDRTRMSALGMLAGLYQPDNLQYFKSELSWQPIPYDTLPFALDETMYFYTDCSRFTTAYSEVITSEEILKEFEPYDYLLEFLTERTGYDMTTIYDVGTFAYLIREMHNVGLETPEWAEAVIDDLTSVATLVFKSMQYTDELKKLMAGPLLNRILDNSRAKINGTLEGRRLVLYSEHDINVMALMSVSQVYYTHAPDYSSTLALELRRDTSTGEYGFSIMYLRTAGEDAAPVYLEVPGCGEKRLFCPFDTFVEITQHLTATFDEIKELCIA